MQDDTLGLIVQIDTDRAEDAEAVEIQDVQASLGLRVWLSDLGRKLPEDELV